MSGVFPPGTRPDEWGTIGDLQRRIQALEATPCCFNSGDALPTYADLVLANPCAYAYWPMDDSSGGARDVVGGFDLGENPTGTGGGQPGGSQGSYSFDYGLPGPFADNPDATAIEFDGDFSVGVPFGTALTVALPGGNPTSSGLPYSMIGWAYAYDNNPSSFWSTYSSGSNQHRFYRFGTPEVPHYTVNTTDAVSSGSLLSGSWRFVATTYTGTSTMTVYLDGLPVGTASQSAVPGAGTLRFGCQGVGTSPDLYWRGRLAQWALFSCVLSAAEIAALAAAHGVGDAEAGMVPVADGSGSYSWEFPLEVQY